MKLASHNSFSYLKPRRWWLRPFGWMARCQRICVAEQYYRYQAQLFDLRIRFDTKTGQVIIAHGLMEYSTPDGCIDSTLTYLSLRPEDIYIRVVLELKHPDKQQQQLFREFCSMLESEYPDLYFFGGNDRSDWSAQHPVYQFSTPMQDLDDKYSSTTTLFPGCLWSWTRWLDDLCPIIYAWLHNHDNIQAGTTHDWLFIDFVDIQ